MICQIILFILCTHVCAHPYTYKIFIVNFLSLRLDMNIGDKELKLLFSHHKFSYWEQASTYLAGGSSIGQVSNSSLAIKAKAKPRQQLFWCLQRCSATHFDALETEAAPATCQCPALFDFPTLPTTYQCHVFSLIPHSTNLFCSCCRDLLYCCTSQLPLSDMGIANVYLLLTSSVHSVLVLSDRHKLGMISLLRWDLSCREIVHLP